MCGGIRPGMLAILLRHSVRARSAAPTARRSTPTRLAVVLAAVLAAGGLQAQRAPRATASTPPADSRADTGAMHPPVFDVHLHALGAADQGPPPVPVCPGIGVLPAPARFLAGTTGAPLDSVRAWAAAGTLAVVGELMFQYGGLAPGDSLPERYFALADSLGIPVALHMGPGPPGAPYYAAPRYRMALGDPLLLEETLVRHPRLRLYVMHAGWPMLDRTLALLWAHPQVYVDLGVIDWAVPRREFHAYLRRLVDAGFGKRILFGSDQMVWPEALEVAIRTIEQADYLTAEQKRDILYNNAVRFLRLDAAGHPPAARGTR